MHFFGKKSPRERQSDGLHESRTMKPRLITPIRSFVICFVVTISVVALGGCSHGSYRLLEQAETSTRNGDTGAAIAAYEKHIAWRLSLTDRPEWENPSFYQLLIGDLFLNDGRWQEAMARYELAHTAGIDSRLVGDRIRSVGLWLESKGELQQADQVLRTYRALDELLFDMALDRVARALVTHEETTKTSTD